MASYHPHLFNRLYDMQDHTEVGTLVQHAGMCIQRLHNVIMWMTLIDLGAGWPCSHKLTYRPLKITIQKMHGVLHFVLLLLSQCPGVLLC